MNKLKNIKKLMGFLKINQLIVFIKSVFDVIYLQILVIIDPPTTKIKKIVAFLTAFLICLIIFIILIFAIFILLLLMLCLIIPTSYSYCLMKHKDFKSYIKRR